MTRETPDRETGGVEGRFTVVGGQRANTRARFSVRVEVRDRDPDDRWMEQAARRRRLVLGFIAVALAMACLFIWVL